MSYSKLNLIEAVTLILIITINKLFINMPQIILLSCGSSSILNAIFISIIVILFTYIVCKLFKCFSSYDIIDVSSFVGGKFLKYIIGIFLLLYLTIISSTFLRDFVEIIHVLYYPDAPILYLLLFFVIITIISNSIGNKSIVKTNVILSILMVISLLISYFTISPNITFERIFPILGYGSYETFFSSLTNIFAFNGLIILYLIPPLLENKKDFQKVSMIAIVISTILIILSTASMLLTFSFSPYIKEVSPLYMLLSNNELGKYLQHPESLFLFTWVLSFMSYLNLICMFLLLILKKLTNVKNEKPFLVPISLIILIIALIPKNIMQVREFGKILLKYVATPATFIVFPIILILANLKQKKIHKNNLDS